MSSGVHSLEGRGWGRFQLRELLGRGAMGAVYRAHDPSLHRDVALKLLQQVEGGTRLERFRREAELTAALEHPGILRVHDRGVEQGVPYIVYELVEGARSLDEAFLGRSLPERVALVEEAARALGAAHAKGIVHRDVKAANVLVGRDGQVKVADFGMAMAEGQDRLTRTGALVGTPYAMAPELMAGRREQVGPPADVYSLGVLLFQACTGELPFRAQSLTELMVEVCNTDAPDPRQSSSDVPAALARICACAMSRKIPERYPDATALAEDLAAWREGRRPSLVRRRGPPLAPWLATAAAALTTWLLLRGEAARAPQPPAATPTPAPSVRPEQPERPAAGTAAWQEQGSEAWATVAREPEPRRQVQLARAFLRDFPGHASAGAAQALLDSRRLYRLFRLRHPERRGRVAALTWAGEVLAVDAGLVARWSLRDGSVLEPIQMGTPPPTSSPVVARGAGHLLIGDADAGAWLWYAEGAAPQERAGQLVGAAISPDGRWVALAPQGRPSRVDVTTADGEAVATLPMGEEGVSAVGFSPDGLRLVVLSGSKKPGSVAIESCSVRIVPVGSWGPEVLFPHGTGMNCLTFVPGQPDRALFGTAAGQILDFDLRQGSYETFQGPGEQVGIRSASQPGSLKALVLDPDGERLYALSSSDVPKDNVLGVWSLSRRELLGEWISLAELGKTSSLELSPDGAYLVLSGHRGVLEVWATDRALPLE